MLISRIIRTRISQVFDKAKIQIISNLCNYNKKSIILTTNLSQRCQSQSQSLTHCLPLRRVSQIGCGIFSLSKKIAFGFSNSSSPFKTNLLHIKQTCERVLRIDPLVVDKLCFIFGQNYALKHKQASPTQSQDLVNLFNQELKKQKSVLPSQDKSWGSAQQIFRWLQQVFKFLSLSKVGFLRGDLHYKTLFELNKNIEFKIEAGKSDRQGLFYQAQDFRALLRAVTNPIEFRLPQKGVYARHLELKTNLYQRQLILEQFSSQQSLDKVEVIVEALLKINKVQEAQVVNNFILRWVEPMILAIREEQNRCLLTDLSPSRRLYGPYLTQLNPQKLATIALNQLIVETFASVYRLEHSQVLISKDYSASINEYQFIQKLIASLESELAYDREQRLFKQAQRQYDMIIKAQKQKNDPKNTKHQQNNQQTYNKNHPQNMDFASNSYENAKTKQDYPQSIKLNSRQMQNQKGNQEQSSSMDKTIFSGQKIKVNQSEGLQSTEEGKGDQRKMFFTSQAFQAKLKSCPFQYVPLVRRRQFLINMRKQISRLKRKSQIDQAVRRELGSLVTSLMRGLLKIENEYGYRVPLLVQQHKLINREGQIKQVSILRINSQFLVSLMPKLYKTEDMFLHMERSVPTLIEPLPWLEPEIGGYYSQATSVMRYSNCPTQQRLIKYNDNSRVFKVLDFLSSTPWKINQRVLQIVQTIWLQGGQANYIPKRYSQHMNPLLMSLSQEKNPQIRDQLSRKLQALRDEHSLRSDFLLKLNIARAFSKLDCFYFPQNLDFRGRVYPIPPHFSHIGSDLPRGLLLFAQGKRLGKGGLRWLKIHTANLMGLDKKSIQQKLVFIEANKQLIDTLAKDPLKHRQWMQYEDCWQAISSIMDLAEALKLEDPEDYVSYLHLHQDGSCNGLQHYAALGRDIQGAYQVNLGPGERPSDVYTHVSKMVISMIEKDIDSGNAKNIELVKKLPDNIKRKTIKQTVMTSVYGVTFIGARKQIQKQIKNQNFLNEEETYQASIYIAKLTLQAISNLFNGAQNIKQWFRECARIIGRTQNPVGWISPLGLPIVQPYIKEEALYKPGSIDIKELDSVYQIEFRQIGRQLDSHQYKQADYCFSSELRTQPRCQPHDVHSRSLQTKVFSFEARKIVFAAVHDSYWAHAGNIDELNQILRDQFIKLHNQPLLQKFKQSLEIRFPQIEFPEIPQRGQFDLNKIRDSLYFFS